MPSYLSRSCNVFLGRDLQLQVVDQLNNLNSLGEKILSKLDDILTEAKAETTVVASVVTLLTNLSQRLADAGTDQSKLDELKATIDANKDAMAAAVLANTPHDPVPIPDDPATTDISGGRLSAGAGGSPAADASAANVPTAGPSTAPTGQCSVAWRRIHRLIKSRRRGRAAVNTAADTGSRFVFMVASWLVEILGVLRGSTPRAAILHDRFNWHSRNSVG